MKRKITIAYYLITTTVTVCTLNYLQSLVTHNDNLVFGIFTGVAIASIFVWWENL